MNGFQKSIIKEALQYEEFISEYESQFINDMAEKDDEYKLSFNQNKLLNRISQKIGQI